MTVKPIGLIRLLRKDPRGLLHWAEELAARGIPANFNADQDLLDTNGALVRKISDLGFEFGGSCNEAPFWEEAHAFQYDQIKQLKDKLEAVTGKAMRSFSSKYSAYNEHTLAIAEKLRIAYVFGRGTAGARAVVYKPQEYDVKIISTSDVPLRNLGGGTLADGSFWSRGATPEDFKNVLFNLKEDRITLVAQSQLSGVKLRWWNVYQEFLDADRVDWKTIDNFTADAILLPNAQIPVNKEVQYLKPQPLIPLEQELDFPFT